MADLQSRRAQLSAAQRALLARRLRGSRKPAESAGSAALPELVRDEAGRHEPFALLDQQRLYSLGGEPSPVAYLEAVHEDLDLERFEHTFNQLIARHDMLRAVFESGRQRVLDEVPAYDIAVLDLRGLDPYAQECEIKRQRRRMTEGRSDSGTWPLFDLCACRVDDRRTVLHAAFSLLPLDLPSLEFLFLEWRKLYEGRALAQVDLSFRDYVQTFEQFRRTALYRRSLDYWQQRLETLPPAPALPRSERSTAGVRRFTRYAWRLSKVEWDRIKERSAPHGLTPSVVLLAAFGEVLAAYGDRQRFSIGSTLFLRQPFHPRVMEILGQFTSMSFAEVDLARPTTFLECCQHLQQQLWKDLEHGFVNAAALLRELLRGEGREEPAAPVVFTSALAHFEEAGDVPPTTWLGKERHAINEQPDVWLENLALENAGVLHFHWDVREELFPSGLIRDMFDSYCRRLHQLAVDEMTWRRAVETRREI